MEAMKKRQNTVCKHHVLSGAGSHCKLEKCPIGWHEYYRTECYGQNGSPFCIHPEKCEMVYQRPENGKLYEITRLVKRNVAVDFCFSMRQLNGLLEAVGLQPAAVQDLPFTAECSDGSTLLAQHYSIGRISVFRGRRKDIELIIESYKKSCLYPEEINTKES